MNFTLYITPENILFIFDSGYTPIKFYKKVDGEFCLYSLDNRRNRWNKGIYNKNGILFCNFYKQYEEIKNFRAGDTIIPVTAVCDSTPEISFFNTTDFIEKQVSVLDYIHITFCRFKGRLKGECRLKLIINPAVRDLSLITSIEIVSNSIGFAVTKAVDINIDADNFIKSNYPDGDIAGSDESDSILKKRYDSLVNVRRLQKKSNH